MKCPKCGLINPDNAMWCDCSFSFTFTIATSDSPPPKETASSTIPTGAILVVVAIISILSQLGRWDLAFPVIIISGIICWLLFVRKKE
jgi:hypothetical protein